MFDFRNNVFKGTIYEIIQYADEIMPPPKDILRAQNWVVEQETSLKHSLPIRKFVDFPNRGSIFSFENRQFMPVDNEPLTKVFDSLVAGILPARSYSEMIMARTIPVSRYIEDPVLRQGGTLWLSKVDTEFRRNGWKLAHLVDAANGVEKPKKVEHFVQRYYRAMSMTNIVPFPSIGVVGFRQSFTPRKDIAEDPLVQSILLGYMSDYIGGDAVRRLLTSCGENPQVVDELAKWEQVAKQLVVETFIKKHEKEQQEIETTSMSLKVIQGEDDEVEANDVEVAVCRQQLIDAQDDICNPQVRQRFLTKNFMFETSDPHFVFVIEQPGRSPQKVQEVLDAFDHQDQLLVGGARSGRAGLLQYFTQFGSCYLEYKARGFNGKREGSYPRPVRKIA